VYHCEHCVEASTGGNHCNCCLGTTVQWANECSVRCSSEKNRGTGVV